MSQITSKSNPKLKADKSMAGAFLLMAFASFLVFVLIQSGLISTINSVALDLGDKMDSMSIASTESNSL